MAFDDFKIRLDNLQKKLSTYDLDAIIITNLVNVAYISGFKGTAGKALITKQEAFLITDFRYTQQAKFQAPYFTVIQYEKKVEDTLNAVISKVKADKVGFEQDTITYEQYDQYLSALSDAHLIPTKGLIASLRQQKQADEVEKIRKAASIADEAFSSILKQIQPGISEKSIAFALEYEMRHRGATSVSFDIIVAAGEHAALPHARPSDTALAVGDLVALDFGCVYEGYCSDMTRTIGIGHLTVEKQKIYHTVLKAQHAALQSIKAKIAAKEVDGVAREIITQAGYGEYFGHGLGHGVGLQVHEAPRMSPISEDVLSEGMVVTVEPGIYVPTVGGVRIEDLVYITKGGIENFTKSPKDLIIL